MWTTRLSIDKKFDYEYNLILLRVSSAKNITYSVNNSASRYIIDVAVADEYKTIAKQILDNIARDIILVYLKHRIMNSYIEDMETSYFKVALMGSLISFDMEYEKRYLKVRLKETTDYNIDGLIYFRLRKLLDNWAEIMDMVRGLIEICEVDDFINVIAFISSTGGASRELAVYKAQSKSTIKDIATGEIFPQYNIYSDSNKNLLYNIMLLRPKELMLENGILCGDAMSVLRGILQIKIFEDKKNDF